jgi:serine/threonine-protein kinase
MTPSSIETEIANALPDWYVGQKLGVGARSSIYRLQNRSTNEVRAIKYIPNRAPEDVRVIAHLKNEYEVLSELHSVKRKARKLIVKPLEFRKVRRFMRMKGAYLLMEFIPGRSLYEEEHYRLDEVLRIFVQVCMALEHIHRCGYVHADLKPHNIMVDPALRVKLIDFGFAAPIGQELRGNKGTFGYLAPEQAAGRLSERTDVFNVGAAMYRVLSGHNVPSIVPGDHEANGFVPDERVNLPPVYHFNDEVPPELSQMILRCCSHQEHKRPTASELGQYLRGLNLRMEYGTVEK